MSELGRTTYQINLEFQQEEVDTTLVDIDQVIEDITMQLENPHQDDWDDALSMTNEHLGEALYCLKGALDMLRNGS